MLSRDSKKLQIIAQHAHGVSRALWPANTRRCIATGRVAQQRRYLISRGKWWATLANITYMSLFIALISSSMLLGGLIVAALAMHRWYILLIPALLLTALFTTATVILARSLQPHGLLTGRIQQLKQIPITPRLRYTPEAPLPGAPLVRALETLDLSQTNVEHFLDQTGKRKVSNV